MYYISGFVNGQYKVTDTKDNVTELYTKEQIYKMIKLMKLDIRGTTVTGNGDLFIPCKSEDFLIDFAKSISRTVVQLKLAGYKGNFNDEITKKAQQFGVVDKGQNITLDLDNNAVILPIQNAMMQFDSNGNYRIATKSNRINILDSDVASYSKLGEKAFDYMYLDIDGREYSMSELIHCINGIFSTFTPRDIQYIGITPSNKMFKFKTGYYIYSVKFGTKKDLLDMREKILNMKAEQPSQFLRYVRNTASMNNIFSLAVIKITEKSYHLSVEGLKQKYKTLHDVYFRR